MILAVLGLGAKPLYRGLTPIDAIDNEYIVVDLKKTEQDAMLRLLGFSQHATDDDWRRVWDGYPTSSRTTRMVWSPVV